MFGLIRPKYVFIESVAEENVGKALNFLHINAEIILLDTEEVNVCKLSHKHFVLHSHVLGRSVTSYI